MTDLERLLGLHEMYGHLGLGIDAVFAGENVRALSTLRQATTRRSANAQAYFWEAMS